MRKLINITILESRADKLYLAGVIRDYKKKTEKFYVVDGTGDRKEIRPVRTHAMDTKEKEEENKKAHKGFYYELELQLHAGASYRFISARDDEEAALSPRFGRFSRLSGLDGCFFRDRGLIVHSENDSIIVSADSLINRVRLERRYKKALTEEAPAEILALRQKAAEIKKNGKPVWLISDRSDSASDNGMALFEFLMNSDEAAGARDRYDMRFVISADSPDFEVMKKIGPVVEAASDLHKTLFIASDLVISSAADNWIRNPLGTDWKYCCDLIDSRFVFLQHGVIKDDLSGWLFKLKKNMSIFITSAYDEWKSICEGNYGYDESVVKLTGLARYDKLDNTPEKKIAFLPTWRKFASMPVIPGSSERPYSETFKDTEYCRFYNRLINDPELLDVMREHGYTGTFYLHPSHMNQWKDYKGNDTISVWKDLIPFSRIFGENALLITDYSSVAIDFAYLGKPVIYTQFDKEAFAEGHSYIPGYYDYERDGFGPVCYDYDSAVSAIKKAIQDDCKEDALYLDRVNSFFAFRDKNNCSRIFKEIMKLESRL